MNIQIRTQICLLPVLLVCLTINGGHSLLAIQEKIAKDLSPALAEDPEIDAVLESVVQEHSFIPGVVAAIIREGKPIRIAAAGVRKAGETNRAFD